MAAHNSISDRQKSRANRNAAMNTGSWSPLTSPSISSVASRRVPSSWSFDSSGWFPFPNLSHERSHLLFVWTRLLCWKILLELLDGACYLHRIITYLVTIGERMWSGFELLTGGHGGGPVDGRPCRRCRTSKAARRCGCARGWAGCRTWWTGGCRTCRWTASWVATHDWVRWQWPQRPLPRPQRRRPKRCRAGGVGRTSATRKRPGTCRRAGTAPVGTRCRTVTCRRGSVTEAAEAAPLLGTTTAAAAAAAAAVVVAVAVRRRNRQRVAASRRFEALQRPPLTPWHWQ